MNNLNYQQKLQAVTEAKDNGKLPQVCSLCYEELEGFQLACYNYTCSDAAIVYVCVTSYCQRKGLMQISAKVVEAFLESKKQSK